MTRTIWPDGGKANNSKLYRLGDMTIYIGWTKLKVYRFILCSIIYIVVLQNTLFTVKPFLSFEWLRSLYAAHHGAWRGHRSRWRWERPARTRPGARPKRGTTSVAWSCIFKHYSFKTTDFKPLKIKQQSCMRALSLSVWEECAFSFCWLWTFT